MYMYMSVFFLSFYSWADFGANKIKKLSRPANTFPAKFSSSAKVQSTKTVYEFTTPSPSPPAASRASPSARGLRCCFGGRGSARRLARLARLHVLDELLRVGVGRRFEAERLVAAREQHLDHVGGTTEATLRRGSRRRRGCCGAGKLPRGRRRRLLPRRSGRRPACRLVLDEPAEHVEGVRAARLRGQSVREGEPRSMCGGACCTAARAL